MQLITLGQVPPAELVAAFYDAFAVYAVKIELPNTAPDCGLSFPLYSPLRLKNATHPSERADPHTHRPRRRSRTQIRRHGEEEVDLGQGSPRKGLRQGSEYS
jgi:hypothetical protein